MRTQNNCTHGVNIFHVTCIHNHGEEQVNKFIYDTVRSNDPVYINFYVNCLNPDLALGIGTQVMSGLSSV